MTDLLDRQAEAADREVIWLIYSREHDAYWRPNSAGYTVELEAAGRYTRADAESRCRWRDVGPERRPAEIAFIDPDGARCIARRANAVAVEVIDGWIGEATARTANTQQGKACIATEIATLNRLRLLLTGVET